MFIFNNLFYKYLCHSCSTAKSKQVLNINNIISTFIKNNVVKSDITDLKKNSYSFQKWYYTIIITQLKFSYDDTAVYLNSEYTMFLIDRDFLQQQISDIFIK